VDVPVRQVANERIADDTVVVRQIFGEGIAPVVMYANSMVIAGTEPVLVDTGSRVTRDAWFDATFSVVEPADVRWIYLSHDDHDHTGNLFEVLDVCPDAQLVMTWFMVERLAAQELVPLDRVRIVNDGERFHAGDRDLVAVVPPTFDSPTTRGLFDAKTGVYWAVDSFATAVPHDVTDLDELDPEFWKASFLEIQRTLSPWHRWLDPAKYAAHVEAVRDLGAIVVAAAHGPATRGAQIDRSIDLLRELPTHPPVELPGQAELELILSVIAGTVAPAPAGS
jgi:flavorubredoxin